MALNDDSRGSIFGNRSDDSPDLSSSFDLFSRSLSNNADALKGNTKELASSSSSLDKNTAALLEMAKSFRESVGDFSDSVEDLNDNTNKSEDKKKKNTQANLSDMKKIYDRSNKNLSTSLAMGQKIGKTVITTFEVVGKRLIGHFEDAAGRVSSKYKEQLSTITAKMQMSNSNYSKMFNEASARFQSTGLNKQFSPVDFADALATTLEEGLRGDEAKRQAYNNLITNKLIPAITTNTASYRRMSKQFQDSFDRNIVAVSKYTEAVYGAEGLEQGKANALYESIESRLRFEASTGEISNDQILETLNKLQFAVGALEDKGVNTDQLISDLNTILEGNTPEATTLMQRYFGVVNTDQIWEKISSNTFGFIEDYVNAYDAKSNDLSAANTLGKNLEANLLTLEQITTMQNNYRREGGDFISELEEKYAGFNSQSEYDKWNKQLQDGYFQSADAAVDKVEENLATGFGVFQSEIPRFKEMASDVKAILGVLVSTLLFTKTKSAVSGSGMLKNFFGGSNTLASTRLGKVANFGGAGSVGGGLLNLAAGPGALLAGGAMMLKDGISVGNENGSLAAGLLASITGDSNIGLTGSQKIDKANETVKSGWVGNSGIDWKKVLGNAGKGAAIGAGVGTAVGGWAAGAGTAIGAGVGALVGSVASIVDQLAESAKFNRLAKASENYEKSLSKLKEASANYESALQKEWNVTDAINTIKKNEFKNTKETSNALSVLKAAFPQYLSNIEGVSELDSDYLELLKEKVRYERILAERENINSFSESSKNLNEKAWKAHDILSNKNNLANKATYDLASWVSQGNYEDDRGFVNKIEELRSWYNEQSGQNLSFDEFVKIINDTADVNGGGHLIFTGNDNGYTTYKTSTSAGVNTAGNNYTQAIDSAKIKEGVAAIEEGSSEYDNLADELVKDALEIMNYASFIRAHGAKDDNGNWIKGSANFVGESEDGRTGFATQSDLDQVVSALNDYSNTIWRIKTDSHLLSQNAKGNYELAKKNLESYKYVWDLMGLNAPAFKIGLNSVPYDDYPALLHKGEMVLTAANANKLRNLGSGGVSGLLDALSAVSSLRAYTVDSTSNSSSLCNAVIYAIQSQTESIVSVLNSILVVVSKINPTPSRENSAVLSENLLNFSGV